jgi:hypothetical protein
LSLTILATALAGAAGPARAQSLGQLKEDIIALDLASEQGMLHLIFVAEDFLDVGKIGQAIKPLNALAHVIDAESEIDSSTADALLSSIESVIDVLVAGPQQWWCDQDGDGYTVDGGVSYFAPSAYCSNDPGLGPDSDDNDAGVNTLQHWWCNYDGDGYWVDMGMAYTAPSPYCVSANEDPGGCEDFDDNDPGIGCV